MDNTKKMILQISNFLSVIFTIIINSLANILPINNRLTGEISDSIPNLFVPAGLTFSIWGVIYTLLVLFAIYQIRDLFRKEKTDMPFLEKIGVLFIISSIANVIWIILWHYEQVIFSLLAMILLFVSLLLIYLRLEIGKSDILLKEKLFVQLPFSVYIGWITVATIANVTAVLVEIGWDGFGISQQTWTILIIIIATILTILVLYNRKDYAYSAVIIWALLGIYLKRTADDAIFGVQTMIANTALIAIISIIIFAIIIALVHYKNIKK
jgi:hypothetical protein